MEYLLNALWGGMELIYFYFFLGAYLPAKKSTRHRVVVFALAWILTIVYTFFAPAQLPKLILTTTMLFVISRHLNNGNWYLHIIYVAIAWMINGLIDTLVLYGVSALLGVSYIEFIWMKLFYVVTVCLSKLISILLAWILYRVRKTVCDQTIHRRWLLLALLFPLVSMVMLAVVFTGFQGESDLSVGAVIFSFFLAVANVAIIYLIGIWKSIKVFETDTIRDGYRYSLFL